MARTINKLNLSLLRDDILLISDDEKLLTVKEMNIVLKEGRYRKDTELYFDIVSKKDVENQKWYLAEKDCWKPDAHRMIMDYLENVSVNEEKVGWFSNAREHIQHSHIEKIEAIMNEAFKDAEEITTYYLKGVEIDLNVENLIKAFI